MYKTRDLSRHLNISRDSDYQMLRQAVTELEASEEIRRGRHRRYGFLHRPHRVVGRLIVTKHGYGFVEAEGGEIEDVFVSPKSMLTAFDGDRVAVSLFANSRGKRSEGEIVEILERGRKTIVGTLEKSRHFYVVIPDEPHIIRDRDIYVPKEQARGARHGDKVVASIESWKSEHENPEGRIIEILGKAGDPKTEVLSIARFFDLRTQFPEEVEREAQAISAMIPEAEIRRRLDLRSELTFTVDPEDAKDFDDAVSLKVLPDGDYELGVHIADVSHYVKEGSALDREALQRGTSVYLVNHAIPMLPERLSSDLCSLKPFEDRLTYSVIMSLSRRGIVKGYQIVKSVINSKRRFTYEEVQVILGAKEARGSAKRHDAEGAHKRQEGRVGTQGSGAKRSAISNQGDDAQFIDVLSKMHQLSQVLMHKRFQEGSIDFETPEVKFQFDKQGKPIKILPKPRLDSHRLIEEFMLLANQTVAKHVGMVRREGDGKPLIYRVHDTPDPEKIRDLANFVSSFGYHLNISGGVNQKALQKLMQEVKGTEVEYIINDVAIRSMAKAVYSEKNIGHFGLAFRYYAHFTSPIRRYPDLIVHRLLEEYADGVSQRWLADIRRRLPDISKRSSEMERRAVDAERESIKLMQVEYMQRHLGDELEGIISGVTNFGIFVEINELYIEGLVHIRDMEDDFYVFDEKNYRLVGRETGMVYRLGDKVRVQVTGVNRGEREIDFILAAT